MSKILVSILSEHVIPNYLILREWEGNYDKIVFITTERMESSRIGENIEEILGYDRGSAIRVVVENDDFHSIMDKLNADIDVKGNHFLVNLTGGTKMMSLATFTFFSECDAEFCYVPVGKNQYYDYGKKIFIPIRYRVSLKEYFALYGIHFECESEFMKSQKHTLNFYKYGCNSGKKLNWKILNAQSLSSPDEKRYYGGVWFEEFSYFWIKERYGLRDDDIACSLKIYRDDSDTNDNEIDVAFVYDNNLYIVECKVTMHGYEQENKVVEKYMYKLAAVSKDFGLHPKSYIFTLHDMDRFKETTINNFNKRMKILGIGAIVTADEFNDENYKL